MRMNDSQSMWVPCRAQLRKCPEGWQVVGELKPNQLYLAHPLVSVDQDNESEYLQYLASQQLEKELLQNHPDSAFRDCHRVSRRQYRNHDLVELRIYYFMLGEERESFERYLYRNNGQDWIYQQTLQEGQSVDRKTGEVR